MAEVLVYSTDPCSFCARAKDLLEKRGIAYEEINLAKDPAGRTALHARTGCVHVDMPATAEKVWRLLRSAAARAQPPAGRAAAAGAGAGVSANSS